MMLALQTIDPTLVAIFYLAAFIIFAVAAWLQKSLIPLGLALFVLPFAWNALAVS